MSVGGLRAQVALAIAGGALVALVLACAPATARSSALKLSDKSAVPGQVVVLSGNGLKPKKAKVVIGGKKAEVATRTKRSLGAVVPNVKPRKVPVVAKQNGRLFRGSLKIEKGFNGTVKLALDLLSTRSAEIGPAGGEVTASGADGTVFTLAVPAGALPAATTITLTPVTLAGVPGADDRLPAVQFGPDGLVLARPATLRITPTSAIKTPVGLAYTGNGTGLTLEQAERQGASLTLLVEHFSGAGATSMTPTQFDRLIARLERVPMSLQAAGELYSALRAVPRAWCDGSPTCTALQSEADQFLGRLSLRECETTAGAGAQVTGLVSALNLILALEADLQAAGQPRRGVLSRCREKLTRAVVDLTKDTTQSDPLGVSGPCAGVVGADYDGDGQVRDLECGLYVGLIAGLQGFPTLQADATNAAEAGLQKVLDDGKAKCDQAFSHAEGVRDLRKGDAMSAPFRLLTVEVAAAIEYCVKITITPSPASVEIGKELDFTAAAKDPADTSFLWSADRGTINAVGHLTAPTTPGPLAVTATSAQQPSHEGHASVTVTCPAGTSAFDGQCQTVGITIDPTSATLQPGGTQQFTATVTGIADTRVTWSASCGSVTQFGRFTAPQAPGSCNVTAASLAVPSKQAVAVVSVQGGSPGTVLGKAAPPTANACGAPQTFIVGSSPASPSYRVPSAGVITSWSHHAGRENVSPGEGGVISIKLKVARRVTPGGNDYTIVGEDGPRTATPETLNTYSSGVRIPVQAGDVIGLTVLTHADCVAQSGPFSGFDVRTPTGLDQQDPAPASTVPTGQSAISAIDVAAILEPDADGDGFGDLTQDQCPSNASTQGPC